jgi:hyperosmotically inducible protein
MSAASIACHISLRVIPKPGVNPDSRNQGSRAEIQRLLNGQLAAAYGARGLAVQFHQEKAMQKERAGKWLAISALVAVLAGCAHAGEKTGAYVDDAWITSKIKSEMVADKTVKARDITVNTSKGVVTLSGTVGSWEESNKAAEIAHGVKGVTEVENHLRIE